MAETNLQSIEFRPSPPPAERPSPPAKDVPPLSLVAEQRLNNLEPQIDTQPREVIEGVSNRPDLQQTRVAAEQSSENKDTPSGSHNLPDGITQDSIYSQPDYQQENGLGRTDLSSQTAELERLTETEKKAKTIIEKVNNTLFADPEDDNLQKAPGSRINMCSTATMWEHVAAQEEGGALDIVALSTARLAEVLHMSPKDFFTHTASIIRGKDGAVLIDQAFCEFMDAETGLITNVPEIYDLMPEPTVKAKEGHSSGVKLDDQFVQDLLQNEMIGLTPETFRTYIRALTYKHVSLPEDINMETVLSALSPMEMSSSERISIQERLGEQRIDQEPRDNSLPQALPESTEIIDSPSTYEEIQETDLSTRAENGGKVDTTETDSLKKTIASDSSIQFFYALIEEGVIEVRKTQSTRWRVADAAPTIIIHEENLREITENSNAVMNPKAEQATDAIRQRAGEIPSDETLKQMAITALRESRKGALQANLLPAEAVQKSLFLSGPSNLTIAHEDFSIFDPARYLDVINATNSNDQQGPVPLPKDKQLKREAVSLRIGDQSVQDVAGMYLTEAEQAGIPLTRDQAWQVAMRESIAHEHNGHSTDMALFALGHTTFDAARPKLEEKYKAFGFNKQELGRIHQEHLARGIGEFEAKRYLIEQCGYSLEQTEQLIQSMRTRERASTEAVYALAKTLQSTGKAQNMAEIVQIDRAINQQIISIFGETENNVAVDKASWPLSDIIAYTDRPYSEEEIRAYTFPIETKPASDNLVAQSE